VVSELVCAGLVLPLIRRSLVCNASLLPAI